VGWDGRPSASSFGKKRGRSKFGSPPAARPSFRGSQAGWQQEGELQATRIHPLTVHSRCSIMKTKTKLSPRPLANLCSRAGLLPHASKAAYTHFLTRSRGRSAADTATQGALLTR